MTWLSDAVVDRLREVATWPELTSDRYEIRRPVGRGGMGTVYAAYDTVLEREVALKVSNALVPDDGLEARLRLEARVLARLEHPGIVPVHDAGVLDDGRLYYVMKLVHGETLAARAPALTTEADRLAVFLRIAETVAFAHDSGVVHRDLQPANVMVGRFGEVLVLDWGVARLVDLIESPGIRVGTPGFMAPELRRGDSATAEPAASRGWTTERHAFASTAIAQPQLPQRLRLRARSPGQPLPLCLQPRPTCSSGWGRATT